MFIGNIVHVQNNKRTECKQKAPIPVIFFLGLLSSMASAHQRSFGALSSASQPRCQQEWIHEQELHRICRQEQHGAPVGDGAGSTVRRREGAVRRRGWRGRGGGGVASAVEGGVQSGWRGGGTGTAEGATRLAWWRGRRARGMDGCRTECLCKES